MKPQATCQSQIDRSIRLPDGKQLPMSPIDLILPRLENVNRYKDGWTACCPAHDSKGRSSLHINMKPDGTVLLYDFGQCTPKAVLQAIGLEVQDLYPQDIPNLPPMKQAERKQFGQLSKWRAALDTLQFEARVIWIAGKQLCAGEPLTISEGARLDRAVDCVEHARRVLNGFPR